MVLSESPVILNAQGYQMLAAPIAKELGLEAVGGEGLQILSQAVRHKNGQFFHRWRPANWTYLFGFRKHEQGRNAVEIPKFDPIVETWDQKIEKLRDLKNQEPAVHGHGIRIMATGTRTAVRFRTWQAACLLWIKPQRKMAACR